MKCFQSVSGKTLVGFLCLQMAIGCTKTFQVPRGDWGGIPEGQRITVTTLDGKRTAFDTAAFYEDRLEGRKEGLHADPYLRIPLDSIEYVEFQKTDMGPVIVLAAGFVAGMAISSALGKNDERPPDRPLPTPSSCPLVYSFNGAGYTLDSETYSGSVAKGLEREDLDNLEHLVEVDGRYRLRMANQRPETQYTDEVSLLVLDHPANSIPLPDADGSVHLVQNLQRPLSAEGFSGKNALSEVYEEDHRSWTGLPLEEANPAVDSDLRDGLVVELPWPNGEHPYLVIRARNTPLAPFALEQFLELQGDGLVPWYRRLKQEEELQGRVREWIEREGWLEVSVEVEGRWVHQGYMRDVGPNLPKAQVVALNLPFEASEAVRVKLESARGLWEVDEVLLGVGTQEVPRVTEAILETALTRGHGDVSELLRAPDEEYFSALEGDEVELTFLAPESPAPGLTRSVLLRTRGFYHLYTRHSGPPQTELVDRVLSEPLFGNRLVLMKWRALHPDRER